MLIFKRNILKNQNINFYKWILKLSKGDVLLEMMKIKTENLLCIILACITILCSLVGLFYSDDGTSFIVENVYGQQVELYGKGIYAYNSTLTVSSRLGADWIGIIGGLFLVFLCVKSVERGVCVWCESPHIIYIYIFTITL